MNLATQALTLAFLLALVGASGCGTVAPSSNGTSGPAKRAEGEDHSLVGQALPEFRMTDLNGQALTDTGLRGKVLLIDFWATWCKPCRLTAPVLQALHQKYGAQGLVVLGADVMEPVPPGQVKGLVANYVAKHHYTYTFTCDADHFAMACGVSSLPTMIFVDRQGIVRRIHPGFREDLQALLEADAELLLNETPARR